MDVRRLGSKHGRRRTPSVQGIILCPLLAQVFSSHPEQPRVAEERKRALGGEGEESRGHLRGEQK